MKPTCFFLLDLRNPYGMAHFRRCNEKNVDLNRNCLLPQEFERLQTEDKLATIYGSSWALVQDFDLRCPKTDIDRLSLMWSLKLGFSTRTEVSILCLIQR